MPQDNHNPELIKYLDEKFEKVDGQFAKTDERFEKVDERFEKMDGQFVKIGERFEKIDRKFDNLFEVFATKEDIRELHEKIDNLPSKEDFSNLVSAVDSYVCA